MTPKPIGLDYETEPIRDRPAYPPVPVGVSIKWPDQKKSRYYAWGHPIHNNCTKAEAVRAVQQAYKSGLELLCHNGKFDHDVSQTHMECGNIYVDPVKLHDTMFILFLLEPHSLDLGLKRNAAKHLGMPPDEQQAVMRWLVDNQKELQHQGWLPAGVRITESNFGEWISLAPGDLVGKYADGDVMRTVKLFQKLYPQVVEAGMLEAYQREQKLMPILLKNERQGIKADAKRLEKDLPVYLAAQETANAWLCKRLKVHPNDINWNAPQQVAELFDKAGVISNWSYTKSGLKSMSKKTLKPSDYADQRVFQVMGYRNKLKTCTGTYMEPWLETASSNAESLVYAGWNQTRNDREAGARTGRLSGSPNFMAVAKSFEDKGDGWEHPAFLKELPHLPLIRTYLLPDAPAHLWGRRDYNQQELRILAHFEDALLLEAYRQNPRLDVHAFVQQAIKELLGLELPRTPIKTLNFGLIYGQGVASMAEKINRSLEETTSFRKAQFSALPGLKDLDKDIKQRGKTGVPIVTWGGRVYYCEEPRVINNHYQTFEYKLLNYLIQGSAADCTKEALVRYDTINHDDCRFVVTVHDEINVSAHKKVFKHEMLKLREVMMSVEFDLPMISDAECGPNWGTMETLKEPPPDLSAWNH